MIAVDVDKLKGEIADMKATVEAVQSRDTKILSTTTRNYWR